MMDVWHTQLRLVHRHFPEASLRALRTFALVRAGGVFVYVTPTVARRETECPSHVVQRFRDHGYTIIHIQEPRE